MGNKMERARKLSTTSTPLGRRWRSCMLGAVRSTIPRVLLWTFFSNALVGCVLHSPLAQSYRGPVPLPIAIADEFSGPSLPVLSHSELLKQRSRFTVRTVTIPMGDDASAPIRLEYYDLPGDAQTPVIILLPILNGHLFVTRHFARFYANRGYAAVIVDGNEGESFTQYLRTPENKIRETVWEHKRVLDWVMQNPEFDPDSIGVFGISLGGINSVILSALDDRVDATVAVMAGGDLPYIFRNTTDRSVIRAASSVTGRRGLTKNDLALHLEQSIATDPLELAPYVDAEKVLMVLARNDTVVPFEKQQELRTMMGNPEAVYLPTGHWTSAVFLPVVRRTSYQFFARRFR